MVDKEFVFPMVGNTKFFFIGGCPMASAGKGGFKSTNTRQEKAGIAVKTANRKDNQAKTTAAKAKARTKAEVRSTDGAGATASRTTPSRGGSKAARKA
jgi:hypothetical protein